MSITNPAAVAFAAVVGKLAPNADEAAHMRDHGPKPAQAVGRAVLAALKAGRDDTEAGCTAFLAALAPAAVPARDLARHGNQRQQQVSKALLAAQAGAAAVDWHVKPPLGRVTIAAGPGDVQTVAAGQPTKVAVTLRRDGDLAAAAACGWRFDGLPPAAYLDTVAFPAGRADAEAAVTVPAQAGVVDPVLFSFQVTAPYVGLDPIAPAPVQGRLLPPVVGQRSVVSVAQGFDAVALSADQPTTAGVVLIRGGGTDALEVPVVVSGLQDGDLAAPAAPARFAAGAPAASTALQFNPGVPGAPDRAAHLAIDASGGGFDVGDPAGFDFAVREPAVVVTRGTLTFTTPLGTVLRDPVAEKVVMVEVAREGVSTREAATIPAVDIVLPPDVLKAAGPAVFGAGQRLGNAPMVLKPYGAGLAAKAVRRTPGKANLLATPDFDLGAFAAQDFVVQDGQDVQPGGNPFHDRLPAEALAVLGFPFGWSMNWSASDVAAWTALTGRRPYVCSGGSHDGGRIATWDKCMGAPGGQADYRGTNFATAMAVIPRGGGGLVPTWWMSPDQGRGSYASLAGSAEYHDRAAGFGRAACAMMVAAGKDPGQLWPRWDKELNQHPDRSPKSPDEVLAYAAAMATFIQGFDEGYTVNQPVKPLHIIGLARHDQIGPLEGWVPKDKAGKSLAAGLDISAHLPNSANGLAGRPVAEQAAATRAWLRGQYDPRPCYSHDHADPKYSGKAVCQKYGMAMCHSETSPRNEANLACEISAGFWLGMFQFWTENAAMMGPVGAFATSSIKPASIPGWSDGIAMLGRCARGSVP